MFVLLLFKWIMIICLFYWKSLKHIHIIRSNRVSANNSYIVKYIVASAKYSFSYFLIISHISVIYWKLCSAVFACWNINCLTIIYAMCQKCTWKTNSNIARPAGHGNACGNGCVEMQVKSRRRRRRRLMAHMCFKLKCLAFI